MSDNWVVQNLQNALNVWNDKLTEIWQLITQSPETFRGGAIWNIILDIFGALQAVGYALLVLFFVVGVVKTCGSFSELKRPEVAVKMFVRFALAKGAITYGMDLMLALLEIVQGVISAIMNAAGFGAPEATILPQEIITAVEDCGFFESIPLWAITLIGGLFIWVLSFVMILSVYGRFQELSQELCRRLSGGRNHCAGMHHLFRVRSLAARSRSGCCRSNHGLELCRTTHFQYAHSRRLCPHGGSCRARDDGIVKGAERGALLLCCMTHILNRSA